MEERRKDHSTKYGIIVTVVIIIIIAGFKIYENKYPATSSEFIADDTVVEEEMISTAPELVQPVSQYENYIGKNASSSDFFKNEEIIRRVKTLIGPIRMLQIHNYWNVESPITLNEHILTAYGCQHSNCEQTNFIILIDTLNDIYYAGVKIEGNTEIFTESGSIIPALLDWKNANEEINTKFKHESNDVDFTKLNRYYRDITMNNFNAYEYFADNVVQYITLKNVSPHEINVSHIRDAKEYVNQEFLYDIATFEKEYSDGDVTYYSFLLKYKCFRTSKQKFEESEIRAEVALTSDGTITSLKYPRVESTVYFNR